MTDTAEGWVSVLEAAEYASCHPKTIKAWLAAGTLPHGRTSDSPNSSYRIKKSDIDAMLLKNSQGER